MSAYRRPLMLAIVAWPLIVVPPSWGQFIAGGRRVRFSEQSFDKTNFNQRTVIAARKRCHDALQTSLELIEKATDLTDPQREKLELAGQLDIHRFFASYASAKRDLRFGNIEEDQWQREFAKAQDKINPLRARFHHGLHDKHSLFAQTMASTLDKDQLASVQRIAEQRRREHYRTYIGVTLTIIERKVPLTIAERTRIVDLLLEKTEAPETYGDGTTPIRLVLDQMARIEPELQEMLAADEWEVLKTILRINDPDRGVKRW